MTRRASAGSRCCGGWCGSGAAENRVSDDTFSEAHELAPPRMVLTIRAVAWATDALSYDDTTVSALARHLGVDWHTCWDAIEVEAKARTRNPDRLKGEDPRGR